MKKQNIGKEIARRRFVQKKALTQEQMTREAEKNLKECLDNICKTLHIQLRDWEIDKNLLLAVLEQADLLGRDSVKKLHKLNTGFEVYNRCYKLVKDMHVRVKPKFRWFLNLNELTQ